LFMFTPIHGWRHIKLI